MGAFSAYDVCVGDGAVIGPIPPRLRSSTPVLIVVVSRLLALSNSNERCQGFITFIVDQSELLL